MGKRARLKKQAKFALIIERRQQIEGRKKSAQAPVINLIKRICLILAVTIALLYIGQTVNERIASVESKIEVTK